MTADSESGGAFFDNEEIDAVPAVGSRALRSNEHEVSHIGIRAPDLGSLQRVTTGHARRASLDALDVRTALRFRRRECAAQLSRSQTWQKTCLLLIVARGKQRAESDPLNHEQITGVVANTPQLFD